MPKQHKHGQMGGKWDIRIPMVNMTQLQLDMNEMLTTQPASQMELNEQSE